MTETMVAERYMEVATPTNLNSNREIVQFHLYNANGLFARKRSVDDIAQRVQRMVKQHPRHPNWDEVEQEILDYKFYSKQFQNQLYVLGGHQRVSTKRLQRNVKNLKNTVDEMEQYLLKVVNELMSTYGKS